MLYLQYFEKVFVCGFVILFLYCFCFVVAAFICMFCIFMTYSISSCRHYKLIDPCNVCMYVLLTNVMQRCLIEQVNIYQPDMKFLEVLST